MQTNVMCIQMEQSEKAFRVNGVTLAKRHLLNTLGKDCNGDVDKALAKFFVIVPFLSEAFECPERASASVKYGAFKAKRLYKALGINEENTVPFMLMALSMAGDMPDIETLRHMGPEVARSFPQGDRDATIIPFPKRTLH